jgi:hypothetical protein
MAQSDDQESVALNRIVRELTPLDQATRDRVLGYVVARFATGVRTEIVQREVES